jgi:peptide/nickel transport system ATP-binding protein
MTDILTIKNLYLGFSKNKQDILIVKGINLSIKKGETYALVGQSGCGKSMTSLAVMQLLPVGACVFSPSQILFGGQDLARLPERDMQHIRGRKIAMIFQEPMTALNPVMTVGEQIVEVLVKHFKLKGKKATQKTIDLFKDVGLHDPEELFSRYPHQLSGGMKQRIMIAMALAGKPDVLIADEPTSALDVTTQAQILELLKEIQNKYKMTLLFITHDLGVVRQIADRVGIMYDGQIVEEATAEDFFAKPTHPYSQKLFACIPTYENRDQLLPTAVAMPAKAGPQANRAESLDVSFRWHDKDYSHNKEITPRIILKANDVKIYFPIKKGLLKRTVGFTKAVDGINLELVAGKTLAIVGESGSGKTTLARALLKLLPITSGEVIIDQNNLGQLTKKQLNQYRTHTQIVFQDPFSSMNPRMLVGDIILEGVKNLKNTTKEDAEILLTDLLQQVGLPLDAKDRYPHEFSGGQRQRIAIARALAVKPNLIICDEPTSALDVFIQAQILNLFKKLQSQQHLSYLFITHNMGVVAYMADHVAIMQHGKIVEQGSVFDILYHPKHRYTQHLLKAVPKLYEDSLN